ncbi:hypothetical protein LTR48_007325 [Friedmanniomyces endolithicus]|uniref:Major facilitator superfamily (MFS) profile domain-containing protein n=1 Tax=Rachicladosporium monterosium TaxID=1507873 RepID=A0ABR0KWE1_9PEZI|nr:hypothetical protein LTR48_007325 [Friedmanniomyces endolithicus]KAK5139626.1 hypothetical protein LTR32_007322 [Rachicladosporium monterosium]
MFGFHKRQRSLISIKELEKEDQLERLHRREDEADVDGSDDEETVSADTHRQTRNLTMTYLLFLAEAIMASSLSAQVAILAPTATGCFDTDASFLRSISECAYFTGSSAGVLWGWSADRVGRRSVALFGLVGMAVCCVSMGFARGFVAFAILRFMAGMIGSAVTVAGMAMLADVTQGSKGRAQVVARLPMIAFCGSLGPLAANSIRHLSERQVFEVLENLVGMIALAEALLLEETLPTELSRTLSHEEARDCEKAAFLGQSLPNNSDDSLTLMEVLNEKAAIPLSSRLTTSQLLTAPSVLVLLASYAMLSLHSTTFDILLPHISHTSTIKLVIAFCAAARILKFVPHVIERVGLLKMYGRMSWAFPVLYTIIPLAGLAASSDRVAPAVAAVISVVAMLVKATLAGAAQVLVLLLILSAAPDAQSTGTTIGVLSIAELFKASAAGFSGISYYSSSAYSMQVVNGSLWAALALTALAGALVTRKLRETPGVGTDIPEACLVWQGMFDSESEGEGSF